MAQAPTSEDLTSHQRQIPARDDTFTVVIPARNAARTLDACLRAVRSLSRVGEVLVVDDGSTDATADIVRRHGFRLLTTPARGAAHARNAGAKAAQGDVIVFLDADVYVPSDLLLRLGQELKVAGPRVAAIQTFYSPNFFGHNSISLYKQVSQYSMMHRRKFTSMTTLGTSCVAIRRSAFFSVGGFDERIPNATIEDWELARRMLAAKFEIVAKQDLQVDHDNFCTLRGFAREKILRAMWFTSRIADDKFQAYRRIGDDTPLKPIFTNKSYFSPGYVLSPLLLPLLATLLLTGNRLAAILILLVHGFLSAKPLMLLKPMRSKNEAGLGVALLTFPFYRIVESCLLGLGVVGGIGLFLAGANRK